MADSPLKRLLQAFDSRDVDQVAALLAPDVHLALVDGREAQGIEDVRRLLSDVFAALRSAEHEITHEWEVGETWFGEVTASYELQDWFRMNGRRRAFLIQAGPQGIAAVHAYGAHEPPFGEHGHAEGMMRIGGRLIPPL